MFDGRLVFDTAVDSEGLEQGASGLANIAQTAIGNILANLGTQIISGLAQIPAQITAVGSSFEASMSQVAATMGITSASEEFDVLSAAAKQAGETTKFSATQAGNALNYLALAGYSAEQAVTALPTVLNTAAAGGLDLAYASDLITDSMSALGLGMDELSSFSDRLAVTSQKSNTNVAQLGEAILTVGGTAKTLSGGVVEMNTALGILADNGIKGAEGGTALRNVILSLSAPTDKAAGMLEQLNVTAFDAAGNMRPLQDTFGDLNTALSKLSDQEKTAALNEIFNKVDLKSVNALLGTSAERFDELSGYIENCEGAASNMAETMSGNLKGDITIMQSSLEGLGVATYEKFAEPMRSAVQGVTEIIGQLTSRIKDGDLSDTMGNIANSFARLTTAAVDLLGDTVLPFLANTLEVIVDKADMLAPVIGSAVTALIAYKGITVAATAAQKLLNGAITANPYIFAATAITSLVSAIVILNSSQESAAKIADRARSAYSDELEEIEKTSAAFEDAKKAADEAASARNNELTQLSYYKSRLDELVTANGQIKGSYGEVKTLVEEINELYPGTIELINGQIKGYSDLSKSIEEYLIQERTNVLMQAKKDKWTASIVAMEEASERAEKLQGDMENAESQYTRFIELQRISRTYEGANGEFIDAEVEARRALTEEEMAAYEASGQTVSGWIDSQLAYWQATNSAASQAWAENQQIIIDSEKAYNEFNDFLKNNPPTISDVEASSEGDNQGGMDTTALSEEINEEFKQKWEKAEHDYKIGVIKSEKELTEQKKALLKQYANAANQVYWKYYEDVAQYEKDAAEELLRQQQADSDKLADEQKERAKKAFDEWSKGFNNLVTESEKAFDDILKQKTALSDKLSDSTSLFTWETATDKKTGEDYKYVYLGDLQKQTQDIQKYADLIEQLKAKNASAEFMAQFADLSVEDGIAFAEKLLDPGTNFDLYMSEWQKQQELISSITNEFYDGAIAELENKFTGKINTALEAIPPNALQAGEDTVQAFIDGVSGLDINKLTLGVLEDADTAALGRTLGEKFGQGFSDGVGSIGIRLADAVETSQAINGARFGGYYGGEQKPAETKVDVTTKVYLDGKEISAASESQTEINQRVQGE